MKEQFDPNNLEENLGTEVANNDFKEYPRTEYKKGSKAAIIEELDEEYSGYRSFIEKLVLQYPKADFHKILKEFEKLQERHQDDVDQRILKQFTLHKIKNSEANFRKYLQEVKKLQKQLKGADLDTILAAKELI